MYINTEEKVVFRFRLFSLLWGVDGSGGDVVCQTKFPKESYLRKNLTTSLYWLNSWLYPLTFIYNLEKPINERVTSSQFLDLLNSGDISAHDLAYLLSAVKGERAFD